MEHTSLPSELNLDAVSFRALAADRLAVAPLARPYNCDRPTAVVTGPSDFDLNPSLRTTMLAADEIKPLRPAAVLVPIIVREVLTVLLTRRTESLPSHAGQISFPGGKVDADDADVVATAVREAHEEVGLPGSAIEPVGFLDPYETATGFQIQPVVGLVGADFEPVANPGEVAEVFEVPLAFLMDPANHQKHAKLYRDQKRYFYAMPFGPHYIWGATAGIIKNMQQRLFAT